MAITRRKFLGYVAGAVGSGVRWPGLRFDRGWAVLDLQQHCSLRESLAGYESTLRTRSIRVAALTKPPSAWAGVIVPAAVRIPAPERAAITTCLRAGATVVIESGAGFAADPDWCAHRALLRNLLDVRIDAPVQLWPAGEQARSGPPYVDYTWPRATKVRDFSRVVPLERACAGEIIAWADGMPVALRRRNGCGTMIFLGSPLGPALWAGDAEARRWLFDVLARPTARRGSAV